MLISDEGQRRRLISIGHRKQPFRFPPLTDIPLSATQTVMAKTPDPNRFHRIVGWVFATGFLILIGLPVLLTSTMGECLPHDHLGVSDCLAYKRIEFVALIFGLPVLASVVGWLTYRWSRFLG
jgi:hypothetical protein